MHIYVGRKLKERGKIKIKFADIEKYRIKLK